MELIVGKIMYKFHKQCKFYILGQGQLIYLFIIFSTFVKLCGCQCIWDLKFEEYWEDCDQLSDTHVIVHTTLILICLLLDAFLDIASFKPWHELIDALIQSHTMFYCSRKSLSMQPMQVHKLINSPMKET